MKITKPSPKEVEEYLKEWNSLENYVQQESALRKLFSNTYPLNNNMDDVLIKACSLNKFYSTNIYKLFEVAKHIVSLEIDDKLRKGDLSLVKQIADIKVNGGKRRNFYSFATKYCSHHNPIDYPIYDSYVGKMIMHFKKVDKFYEFKKSDLKDYSKYRNIYLEFRDYYKLKKYCLKQIDRYLWQAGKKYFGKKR